MEDHRKHPAGHGRAGAEGGLADAVHQFMAGGEGHRVRRPVGLGHVGEALAAVHKDHLGGAVQGHVHGLSVAAGTGLADSGDHVAVGIHDLGYRAGPAGGGDGGLDGHVLHALAVHDHRHVHAAVLRLLGGDGDLSALVPQTGEAVVGDGHIRDRSGHLQLRIGLAGNGADRRGGQLDLRLRHISVDDRGDDHGAAAASDGLLHQLLHRLGRYRRAGRASVHRGLWPGGDLGDSGGGGLGGSRGLSRLSGSAGFAAAHRGLVGIVRLGIRIGSRGGGVAGEGRAGLVTGSHAGSCGVGFDCGAVIQRESAVIETVRGTVYRVVDAGVRRCAGDGHLLGAVEDAARRGDDRSGGLGRDRGLGFGVYDGGLRGLLGVGDLQGITIVHVLRLGNRLDRSGLSQGDRGGELDTVDCGVLRGVSDIIDLCAGSSTLQCHFHAVGKGPAFGGSGRGGGSLLCNSQRAAGRFISDAVIAVS